MQRIIRTSLLVSVLALLALAPVAVRAQTPLPRPASDATVAGEVTDVNPLTVKVNGQQQLLQTSPTLTVVRDGKDVKLGDLKQGDKVAFTTNPDNTVQRIDVTDPAADRSLWLLIGLLVLVALVAVGLIWYLKQRRTSTHGGARRDDDPTIASPR